LQTLLTTCCETITNTCQLKLQSGVFGVTSLFISCNIKAKSMCVYVYIAASEKIDIDIFTTHLLTPWVWNDWVSFFENDNND